jgi:tetratricopeptide (TPR) repeat protein
MLEAIPEQDEANKDSIRAATEAKLCADKGEWDAARAAMTRAIDATPSNAGYHALMAWYTYQCSIQPAFERQRLAEHHLSVALELEPENHQAHYYQGLIWAGGGNTTRARIALAQALTLKPGFQAAAQALDKINKAATNEPSASQVVERPAFGRSRKAKLVLPLAIATVLMAAGGGYAIYVSGQQPGASELAQQLGTKLEIASASRVGSGGQDLHVDVGISWAKLPAGEQSAEMETIARNAQGLGIVNIFVYSASEPVAESHAGKVCVGACVTKVEVTPVSGGAAEQATLKVPKP